MGNNDNTCIFIFDVFQRECKWPYLRSLFRNRHGDPVKGDGKQLGANDSSANSRESGTRQRAREKEIGCGRDTKRKRDSDRESIHV